MYCTYMCVCECPKTLVVEFLDLCQKIQSNLWNYPIRSGEQRKQMKWKMKDIIYLISKLYNTQNVSEIWPNIKAFFLFDKFLGKQIFVILVNISKSISNIIPCT